MVKKMLNIIMINITKFSFPFSYNIAKRGLKITDMHELTRKTLVWTTVRDNSTHLMTKKRIWVVSEHSDKPWKGF